MLKRIYDKELKRYVEEYNGYRVGDIVTLQGYGEAIKNFPCNQHIKQEYFEIELIYLAKWEGWGFRLKGFKRDQHFRIGYIKFHRRPNYKRF